MNEIEIEMTSQQRTTLVVSGDPEIRADWARYFESIGMRTLRCVGPQVQCVLLDGARCPLHEEADLAVYDRATLTPELTLRLIRAGRTLAIAFAADRLGAAGHHEPHITSIAAKGLDACVGLSGEKLGR